MNIGILGAGKIGATLMQKLAAVGHHVRIANRRGPESIQAIAMEAGASAVTAAEAIKEADAIILSIPLNQMPSLRSLLEAVPADIPIIDTSNYYPLRDGRIPAIDEGLVESRWVEEQLGRPVVRAWNAVLAGTLRTGGKRQGEAGRTAIPVSGDDASQKAIAMELVDATGFDAVDIGGLDEAWRISAGNPAYCTDLSADELRYAVSIADAAIAARRRDATVEIIMSFGSYTNEDFLAVNRAIARVPRSSGTQLPAT